jgi:predicted GIY-YIG superfamily endonuclease
MQFWVYILRCSDGSYYTGHTDDLDKRMAEHQQGKGGVWTRTRRPVMLVWCDWAGERYEALAFERRVKNWSRAKKEALIAGDWERVGYFAKPPHERLSTSLGTNGVLLPAQPPAAGLAPASEVEPIPDSFVPSEVEGRLARLRDPQ